MSNKSIEYIAIKSKELLLRQINAYHKLSQKSGLIIGIASVFMPLFISIIMNSSFIFKIFSLIPMGLFFTGILFLLFVIKADALNQGFDETKFEELLNKDLKKVHKEEIAYNKHSIEENDRIFNKKKVLFFKGLVLIIVSIIVSILIMISIVFFDKKQNGGIMAKNEKKQIQKDDKSNTEKKRKEKLPKIDPKKVKKYSELDDSKKT